MPDPRACGRRRTRYHYRCAAAAATQPSQRRPDNEVKASAENVTGLMTRAIIVIEIDIFFSQCIIIISFLRFFFSTANSTA